MELNLLFLPLLGGYIFYTRFHGTSYWAERASGHNLLFGSAAFGLLFLIVARLIVLAVPHIGVVDWTPPIPKAAGAYLRLLPMMSGYRHRETKEMYFTAYYDSVYKQLLTENSLSETDLEKFIKVLPIAAISSANRFNPDAFLKFAHEEQMDRSWEASSAEHEVPDSPVPLHITQNG